MTQVSEQNQALSDEELYKTILENRAITRKKHNKICSIVALAIVLVLALAIIIISSVSTSYMPQFMKIYAADAIYLNETGASTSGVQIPSTSAVYTRLMNDINSAFRLSTLTGICTGANSNYSFSNPYLSNIYTTSKFSSTPKVIVLKYDQYKKLVDKNGSEIYSTFGGHEGQKRNIMFNQIIFSVSEQDLWTSLDITIVYKIASEDGTTLSSDEYYYTFTMNANTSNVYEAWNNGDYYIA